MNFHQKISISFSLPFKGNKNKRNTFYKKLGPVLFLVIYTIFLSSFAHANVFTRIEIRNNKNVDDELIKSVSGIQLGKNLSSNDIDDAIKRLFELGLFSDVRIVPAGKTLIINVSEYQIVNSVVFKGNKKIKTKQLSELVQLKARSPFSASTLDTDVQAIKESYARVGQKTPSVSHQTVNLGNGRVDLIFHIKEGKPIKIKAINFHGNKAFGDRKLSQIILTKPSSILSFILHNDIYDKDRLQVDEEALRQFYMDRGYADFQVTSSSRPVNKDNTEYQIDFTIHEGPRYRFSDISIRNSIADSRFKNLKSSLITKEGQIYSARRINNSVTALNEYIASYGYAFADVSYREERRDNGKIALTYTIDQTRRTYIERIEISGNQKTRENIIRREFDISEGDVFSPLLIRRARRRLENLDYFQKIDILTENGSNPDSIILLVKVQEKRTGEISVGAGYSVSKNGSAPTLQASLIERNLLGKGQSVRFSVGGGRDNREYTASFMEPYFLGNRVSVGLDLSAQVANKDLFSADNPYYSETLGLSVPFGFPITDSLRTKISYNLSSERYNFSEKCKTETCPVSTAIQEAITSGAWVTSSVKGDIIYTASSETQNSPFNTQAVISNEIAGIGGDAEYLKIVGQLVFSKQLQEEYNIVGNLSFSGGKIIPTAEAGLRVFDQFRSTSKIIRGFAYNGIGPYDSNSSNADHLGGTTYMSSSLEFTFPLPFIPENFGFSSAVFLDAATLYDSKVSAPGVVIAGDTPSWRVSVGSSLIWNSPFGPLRIDYAIPLKKEETDLQQEFNFGVSSQF